MKLKYLLLPAIFLTGSALAADITLTTNERLPEGNGKAEGKVTKSGAPDGRLCRPKQTGLDAGIEGFHAP